MYYSWLDVLLENGYITNNLVHRTYSSSEEFSRQMARWWISKHPALPAPAPAPTPLPISCKLYSFHNSFEIFPVCYGSCGSQIQATIVERCQCSMVPWCYIDTDKSYNGYMYINIYICILYLCRLWPRQDLKTGIHDHIDRSVAYNHFLCPSEKCMWFRKLTKADWLPWYLSAMLSWWLGGVAPWYHLILMA